MNTPLDTLLRDPSFDPREPASLMRAFAVAGRAGAVDELLPLLASLAEPSVTDAALAARVAKIVVPPPARDRSPAWPSWLIRHVEAMLGAPPSERSDVALAWLARVEALSHALDAARALVGRVDGANGLVDAWQRVLARCEEAVRGRPGAWWRLGAEAASRAVAAPVPWSWISAALRGLAPDTPAARGAWTDAWIDAQLHPEDAAALVALVRVDAAWRASYREALARALPEVTREPDVRDLALDDPPSLSSIALPHLGHAARLEAFEGDERRTLWRWPDHEHVADGELARIPVDEIVGELEVRVIEHQVTEADARWRAVCAARAVAACEATDARAEAVALAVCERLGAATWVRELDAGRRCFDDGTDPSDGVLLAVEHALEARVALGDCELRCASDALRDALDAVDDALDAYADAVLLLDEDRYRELVEPGAPVGSAWWERRATERLDARDGVIDVRDKVTGEIDRILAGAGEVHSQPATRAPSLRQDIMTGTPAWSPGEWEISGVRVDLAHASVEFRLPLAPSSAGGYSSSRADDLDDPGRDGQVVFRSNELELRVAEVPTSEALEALVCVRALLHPDASGDLSAPDALLVRTALGADPLEPVRRGRSYPLQWWALFKAAPSFVIEVSTRAVAVRIEVRHPSKAR